MPKREFHDKDIVVYIYGIDGYVFGTIVSVRRNAFKKCVTIREINYKK